MSKVFAKSFKKIEADITLRTTVLALCIELRNGKRT
jgi:hypothetical protein